MCWITSADKGIKLCDLASYSCISDAYGNKRYTLHSCISLVNQKERHKFLLSSTIPCSEDVREREDQFCSCLPPCSDVWYDPEISYATFPGRGFNLTRTFKRLVAGRNLSSTADGNEYFKFDRSLLNENNMILINA